MIRQHQIDIYVNNRLVDVFPNTVLRFNNQFVDPTKIETISGEYTFSFKLPESQNNVDIFGFANVLSRRGKFNKHYPTKVSIDGIMVFDGDLILQGFSKKDGFDCNLFINRLNTVEKIFGDSVLSDISGWTMEFNEEKTINETNKGMINYYTRDCCFPLISYGLFQKLPKEDGQYTPKHTIDGSNRFYLESFFPSFNLLRTVEKCFNHKGYRLSGDIFDDEVLKKIYMTTKLSDGQSPAFNLGSKLGESEISFTWRNTLGRETSGRCSNISPYLIQTLDEPIWGVGYKALNAQGKIEQKSLAYNFEKVNVYDIWSSTNFVTIDGDNNKYLWRQNRFVAPTSGYYEIELNLNCSIEQGNNTYPQYFNVLNRDVAEYGDAVILNPKFDNFPIEFQLIRNNNDGNVGLICPKSLDEAFKMSNNRTNTDIIDTEANLKVSGYTAYPHEKANNYLWSEYGYRPKLYIEDNNTVLNYDPRVNEHFILGTCVAGPHKYNSVIKNGKSWDATCDKENQSRYNNSRYKQTTTTTLFGTTTTIDDAPEYYGLNYLKNAINSLTVTDNSFSSTIRAIVYLEKNDYLQLKCIQRRGVNAFEYDLVTGDYAPQSYLTDAPISVNGSMKFRAYAPKTTPFYVPTERTDNDDDKFVYGNESFFPKKLDLSQFLSDDEKMSDFVNNFIKEFNLSYSQNGKDIYINKQKLKSSKNNAVVELDDRVAETEIDTEVIDFPSQMSVEYTIDKEERGVYISAEKNATDGQMQESNWTDYADKGYDIIKLSEDEYSEETKVQTKTSYCWYEDFQINYGSISIPNYGTISIPVIGKDEWYIEGYKYSEMMKKDGYGLARRYFFPKELSSQTLNLYGDGSREKIPILLCSNEYQGVELSYKAKENETLLTRYFNPYFTSDGNYIKFKCHLTPSEYVAIKEGATIRIDNDLYMVTSIQGYDPSGVNACDITAMQRIVTASKEIEEEIPSTPENPDVPTEDIGYVELHLKNQSGGIRVGFENGRIPDYYFEGMDDILFVKIEHSITHIGHRVFNECRNLYQVRYVGTAAEFDNVFKGICLGSNIVKQNIEDKDEYFYVMCYPEDVSVTQAEKFKIRRCDD